MRLCNSQIPNVTSMWHLSHKAHGIACHHPLMSARRESDAEHPMFIPMDVSTSPTTPLGPMTRARAKSIEDKVNPLLSELPLSA